MVSVEVEPHVSSLCLSSRQPIDLLSVSGPVVNQEVLFNLAHQNKKGPPFLSKMHAIKGWPLQINTYI